MSEITDLLWVVGALVWLIQHEIRLRAIERRSR